MKIYINLFCKKVDEALKMGVIVAAICGATIGLANYEFLDDRKHTSNSLDYMKMVCPNYNGENLYEMGPVASDQNLITASGVAPLEFAMEVLKKLDVLAPDAHFIHGITYIRLIEPDYFFQLMNSLNN